MIIRTGATILSRAGAMGEDMVTRRTSQIERAVDKIEKIIKALTITYLNPMMQSGNEVSIKEFLQSIIDLHHGLCVQHEIELQTSFPEDIKIPGNPLHLSRHHQQRFLFPRSIRFSNCPEKWIEMAVNRAKNDIIITVKDSCTDSQDDPRQKLFQYIESMALIKHTSQTSMSQGLALASPTR